MVDVRRIMEMGVIVYKKLEKIGKRYYTQVESKNTDPNTASLIE